MTAQDAPRSTPIAGDVVIAKRAGSESAYTLSVVPGPAQLWIRSYDGALAMASRFAAIVGVDVSMQEGRDSWLVAEYRSASPGLDGAVDVERIDRLSLNMRGIHAR